MEASLQESQRQAMSLGSRLTLTEAKNDELLSQTQVQFDQLAEAATKANKLVTKLEQCKQQLEKAQREIKDLKEAAQVGRRLAGEPGCGKLITQSTIIVADLA